MPATVSFAVDPRLAALLGDSYRSTEQAIKELIDNAWDADSEEVIISLPSEMSGEPITIRDDGCGMTEEELRSEYLKVARDRRTLKGNLTGRKRRPVRGRRGVGKFSGLMVADQMEISTRARGREAKLLIDRAQLMKARSDFEAVEFAFTSQDCERDDHGTTVTLSGLNRRLSHLNPEKLRRILVLDYGRAADFKIIVNGQLATLHDIPGESYSVDQKLPTLGDVKMSFAISDGKQVVKHPGIVIKVGGKPIGDPSFFGLDKRDTSNRTMKKVVEEYTDGQYKGDNAAKRPDLLLLSEMYGQHLLIEFKRPSKTINRDDETQAQKYRDDLGTKFHPMKILLIRGGC